MRRRSSRTKALIVPIAAALSLLTTTAQAALSPGVALPADAAFVKSEADLTAGSEAAMAKTQALVDAYNASLLRDAEMMKAVNASGKIVADMTAALQNAKDADQFEQLAQELRAAMLLEASKRGEDIFISEPIIIFDPEPESDGTNSAFGSSTTPMMTAPAHAGDPITWMAAATRTASIAQALHWLIWPITITATAQGAAPSIACAGVYTTSFSSSPLPASSSSGQSDSLSPRSRHRNASRRLIISPARVRSKQPMAVPIGRPAASSNA